MRCAYCWKELPDTAQVCGTCGKRQPAAGRIAQKLPDIRPESPDAGRRTQKLPDIRPESPDAGRRTQKLPDIRLERPDPGRLTQRLFNMAGELPSPGRLTQKLFDLPTPSTKVIDALFGGLIILAILIVMLSLI